MKKIIQWMKEHKKTVISLFIISGALCSYYVLSSDDLEDFSYPEALPVERGDITVSVSGTGQVYAGTQVDLEPQVAGDGLDIVDIRVENDQKVNKDDIIAVLDTTEIDQKISTASLNVQSSQISLKQVEYDFDTQTKNDKYQRQAKEISLAQNQVALSNYYEDLEEYYIRAPFDGTITGLDFETGDSISRTETLASVITDDVKAEISLNEVDAAMVEIGNEVQLTFDALEGVTAIGKVSKVDTIGVVDGGVVTYDVEIVFDSPSELLKPGMSTNVEINIASAINVLQIPQSAVKENKNGEFYVMLSNGGDDPGNVVRRIVETGITDDVMIEIKNGLSEKESVVIKMNSGSSNSSKSKESETGSLLPTPGSGRGPGGGQGSGR